MWLILLCWVFSGKVIIATDGLSGKTVGLKKSFNCPVYVCFEDFISLYYIIGLLNLNRITLFFMAKFKKIRILGQPVKMWPQMLIMSNTKFDNG